MFDNKQIPSTYWVGNLGQAAAFVAMGNTVTGIRLNPNEKQYRKTQFGFDRSQPGQFETLEGLRGFYQSGQLQVSASTFYEAINGLRKQRREFEVELPANDDNLTNLH